MQSSLIQHTWLASVFATLLYLLTQSILHHHMYVMVLYVVHIITMRIFLLISCSVYIILLKIFYACQLPYIIIFAFQ